MHSFLAQPDGHLPLRVEAFGNQIRLRRQELGMNIRRAALITGITLADWQALEEGWVPIRNQHLLRSLAGTLQIHYDVLVNAIAPLEAHFAETAA
jgi:hypothetical protein